jgi:hypothetical protein
MIAFAASARAQVTATCMLNEVENRVYGELPLEGTLKSTEEALDPELPFLQYLPNGYDATKLWPVILFMHGIGEVGGTLRGNTAHSLPRVVESPDWNWPFIVLSPVLPNPNWHARSQLVADILDYAISDLGGDPNRLYLSGLSHGGEGTVAIGIDLAERIAALMPVCQGGGVDNWDQRTAIINKPFMAIIGTEDAQYNNALGWAMDMEASGASAFSDYLIPTAEEQLDTIPMTVLNEQHVFVSYENIPHDVWHAAYGVFCGDTITTYKTVQYEWLLKQSLDGSPFVDPRDGSTLPGTGGAGGVGGAAGAAGETMGGAGGTGGATEAGAAGSMAAAGMPSTAGASAAGTTNAAGAAGAPGGPVAAAGSAGASMTPVGMTPAAPTSTNSEGGGCAVTRTSDAPLWLLLGSVASWLALHRRRSSKR